jgi:hypothetical protein
VSSLFETSAVAGVFDGSGPQHKGTVVQATRTLRSGT